MQTGSSGTSSTAMTTSLPVYRVNESGASDETSLQTTTIPVHLEYNSKESAAVAVPAAKANKNQSLQSLLLQFQKNSLLPKLIKRKTSNAMPIPSVIEKNPDNCKKINLTCKILTENYLLKKFQQATLLIRRMCR